MSLALLALLPGCGWPSCPTGQAWDERNERCADIAGPGVSDTDASPDTAAPDTAAPDTGGGDTGGPPTAAPTRILLVSLDTTRRDALADSPWLTTLAERGTTLPSVWSNTWTYPSIGKLLTSQRTIDWGPGSWAGGGGEELQDDIPTVLEYLHGQGFAVVALNQNDGQAGRGTALVNRDTSELDAYVTLQQGDSTWVGELPALLAPYAKRDTFLWIHLAEAHDPYTQPAESCVDAVLDEVATTSCPYAMETHDDLARVNSALADGSLVAGSSAWSACRDLLDAVYSCDVRYQDDELARVWSSLEDAGFLDDQTVVALVADHGEGLLDPWTFHGFDMRATISGVFALFFGPGVEPGLRIEEDRSMRDVVPSVLALAGVPPMPTATGTPYWEPAPDDVITQFYCGVDASGDFAYFFGVVGEGHHLIRRVGGSGAESYALYDLRADPLEVDDLVPAGAELPPTLVEAANASYATVWGKGYCTAGAR